MKKAFTLVELIFVIVIIGVLSAVAIPKYQNLKMHAEFNNAYKIMTDFASFAPSVYYNLVELEGKDPNKLNINDLLEATKSKTDSVTVQGDTKLEFKLGTASRGFVIGYSKKHNGSIDTSLKDKPAIYYGLLCKTQNKQQMSDAYYKYCKEFVKARMENEHNFWKDEYWVAIGL